MGKVKEKDEVQEMGKEEEERLDGSRKTCCWVGL